MSARDRAWLPTFVIAMVLSAVLVGVFGHEGPASSGGGPAVQLGYGAGVRVGLANRRPMTGRR